MKFEKTLHLLLQGGIGNQLFQLFAGLYVSIVQHKNLILDFSLIDKRRSHEGSLRDLKFPGDLDLARIGLQVSNRRIITSVDSIASRSPLFAGIIQKLGLLHETKEIGYQPNLEEQVVQRFFRGYFQTDRYVSEVEKLTKQSLRGFVSARSNSRLFQEYTDFFNDQLPIVLHVRRGDYVNLQSSFGLLAEVYFIENLKVIRKHSNSKTVCVFSDSYDYATKISDTITRHIGLRAVPMSSELSSAENLVLMSLGSGHLLSNSSFSWWGSRLSLNSLATIHPDPWFKSMPTPSELIPKNWIPSCAIWEENASCSS